MFPAAVLAACLLCALFAPVSTVHGAVPASEAQHSVAFLRNVGQQDARVLYEARTPTGQVLVLRNGGLVYSLSAGVDADGRARRLVLRESLSQGLIAAVIAGQPSPTRYTRIARSGNDAGIDQQSIPAFEQLDFGNVYPGINYSLQVGAKGVEKIFRVSANADPAAISLAVAGANKLSVDEDGSLFAHSALGAVRFSQPVAWQVIDGERVAVPVDYRIDGAAIPGYGFALGDYDRSRELFIDPYIASTYLGGSSQDAPSAIAVDADGSVLTYGTASATDFPTTSGVYKESSANLCLQVSRFSADLTTLQAATYICGNAGSTPSRMVIAPNGSIYITGHTQDTTFPVTAGAYQIAHVAHNEGFISRLSSDLTTLEASTYLGGSLVDSIKGLAVDATGDVFVAGQTNSTDFPVTSGVFDPAAPINTFGKSFISRLSGDLTTLEASTHFGGGGYYGGGVARVLTLAADGSVWVAGNTASDSFPATMDAYSASNQGDTDAYLGHLDRDLETLHAATLIGGNKDDTPYELLLDGSGGVWIHGSTRSGGFPHTAGAVGTQSSTPLSDWGFVSHFSGDLTQLHASGWTDTRGSMRFAGDDHLLIAGSASVTSDLPTYNAGVIDPTHNGVTDVYVARLRRDLTAFEAATFVGGSSSDTANSGGMLAMDGLGNFYLAVNTQSNDAVTSPDAFDTSHNGHIDTYIYHASANLLGGRIFCDGFESNPSISKCPSD